MDLELEVKKEVVDEHVNTTSHRSEAARPTDDEEATIAQLSLLPASSKRKRKPKTIFSAVFLLLYFSPRSHNSYIHTCACCFYTYFKQLGFNCEFRFV